MPNNINELTEKLEALNKKLDQLNKKGATGAPITPVTPVTQVAAPQPQPQQVQQAPTAPPPVAKPSKGRSLLSTGLRVGLPLLAGALIAANNNSKNIKSKNRQISTKVTLVKKWNKLSMDTRNLVNNGGLRAFPEAWHNDMKRLGYSQGYQLIFTGSRSFSLFGSTPLNAFITRLKKILTTKSRNPCMSAELSKFNFFRLKMGSKTYVIGYHDEFGNSLYRDRTFRIVLGGKNIEDKLNYLRVLADTPSLSSLNQN